MEAPKAAQLGATEVAGLAKYYEENRGTFSHITAVSDKQKIIGDADWDSGEGYRATASVTYAHPRHEENFYANGHGREGGLIGDGHGGRKAGDPDGSSLHENIQGRLVEYHRGQVTGAFADPTMRAHMPTLLGLAGQLSHRMTGGLETPMPDSSLSKHSSPMVQKLRDKGLDLPINPKNPKSKVTNDIGMNPQYEPAEDRAWETPLSDTQVNAGKQMIRGILRPHRETPDVVKGPQFTDGYKGKDDPTKPRQLALFTGRELKQAQSGTGRIANK